MTDRAAWLGSCQWVPAALCTARASRNAEDTGFPEVRQTLPHTPHRDPIVARPARAIASRSGSERPPGHAAVHPVPCKPAGNPPGRPSCRGRSSAVHRLPPSIFPPRRRWRERRWPPSLRAFSRQCRGLPIAVAWNPPRPETAGKALWGALCLSCGTSPERIAPESLTRSMSDFVHGHISWRTDLLPPNRVTGLTQSPPREPRLVNASLARRKPVGWRSHREPRRTEARSLRLGGGLARLRARDELRRLHDAKPDRRGNRNPVRNHDPRAGDRREPQFDVAQLHEVLDRVALGNVSGDRRKAHGTDDRSALIAFIRPHLIEPLEGQLQIVAHAAVEDRKSV